MTAPEILDQGCEVKPLSFLWCVQQKKPAMPASTHRRLVSNTSAHNRDRKNLPYQPYELPPITVDHPVHNIVQKPRKPRQHWLAGRCLSKHQGYYRMKDKNALFANENLFFKSLANSPAVGCFGPSLAANWPCILCATLWITMFTT
ncbi:MULTISPECIES: hypothetical protein [unclassified Polaromonas]|uniref:hypothetical protein n=1 Tax=unclassified Polaromonas TaxID=2638319 RepID=UPI0018CBC2E8|nr:MULTISPECIES: hypothetical protein [unclassified Polaromonas]MBG6072725.1 hypothetical protein [Polaromonas sp. CG_9.7]MBG6114729.1 hypothetical protein [Polaromonas sp. CG_9.2]MDH6184576.1 hypothetical protein [Polaromonas sp. CG_23.6]